MRFFLDTEFNEDGVLIDLISIALVREDGEAYYAVSSEASLEMVNDWVKANVLPHLPPVDDPRWKTRAVIAAEVRDFLLRDQAGALEIWGYFADYDWVALCQLYGRMVNLPKGFPMWCHDLKQLMESKGVSRDDLPKQESTEHDALNDARWLRVAYVMVSRL